MAPKRRRGQRGLRRRPEDGWPLDRLLVGIATLRTTRELCFQEWDWRPMSVPPRPWDLALWSGVSPKSAADAMERAHRIGLVTVHPGNRPGEAAGFRLDRAHPLASPLIGLFMAERMMVRRGSSRVPPRR